MGFSKRITVAEGNGNILVSASGKVAALMAHYPAIAASGNTVGLDNDTPVKLQSVREAELLGLSSDTDITEGALLFYHIEQFFAQHEGGTLWISTADPQTPWDSMVSLGSMEYAEKMLMLASLSEPVRYLGLVFNPKTTYTPTLVDGLDDNVWVATDQTQLLAQSFREKNLPFVALVEGRQFNGSVASALDLKTLGYDSVGIVIGADYTPSFRDYLSNTSNTFVNYHAAIGTALGCLSKSPVNESMGFVGGYDIQDTLNKKFLAVGLSSGLAINDGLTVNYTDDDLGILHEKNYIFMYKDVHSPGTYISDSWNCTDPTKTDYSDLELRRTMDEALIRGRRALRPFQNMTIQYKENGSLDDGILAAVQGAVENALEEMKKAKLISFFNIKIDPKQNVRQDGLKIRRAIRPTDTARIIEDTVNYTL